MDTTGGRAGRSGKSGRPGRLGSKAELPSSSLSLSLSLSPPSEGRPGRLGRPRKGEGFGLGRAFVKVVMQLKNKIA